MNAGEIPQVPTTLSDSFILSHTVVTPNADNLQKPDVELKPTSNDLLQPTQLASSPLIPTVQPLAPTTEQIQAGENPAALDDVLKEMPGEEPRPKPPMISLTRGIILALFLTTLAVGLGVALPFLLIPLVRHCSNRRSSSSGQPL